MRRTGATHLYVPSACCDRLASKVQYSARFDVLYNRGGALVAELRRSGNSP
jgi:hypothetical protein